MHFALVIPELHKRGGTERCMASLAEALQRRGHRFTVFANRTDPAVLPEAKRWRVPMVRRPHLLRFFSFLVAQGITRFFAEAVARRDAAMGGERFDLVLSTGPDVLRPGMTVLHCSAAGFAQLAREESQQSAGSLLSRLKRWNSALSYRAIAKIERRVVGRGARTGVTVSQTLKDEFREFHGERADSLQVIPDGVDLSEFYPTSPAAREHARARLNVSSEQKVVLFVGHNWYRKGLPTLVEAINQIDRAVLVVAGAGERLLRSTIEQTLQGRVRFVGTCKEMSELYAAADALVLPTLHEPFGLPVLEAMACGVPVVVSRRAGVAELITDGVDGLLLEDPTDAAELTRAIARILDDSSLRNRMSAAGARTAERYSWDTLAEQFEALCWETCREAAGRNGR
jgi:glycosyltransferase involved in cell wall biosynthesis